MLKWKISSRTLVTQIRRLNLSQKKKNCIFTLKKKKILGVQTIKASCHSENLKSRLKLNTRLKMTRQFALSLPSQRLSNNKVNWPTLNFLYLKIRQFFILDEKIALHYERAKFLGTFLLRYNNFLLFFKLHSYKYQNLCLSINLVWRLQRLLSN